MPPPAHTPPTRRLGQPTPPYTETRHLWRTARTRIHSHQHARVLCGIQATHYQAPTPAMDPAAHQEHVISPPISPEGRPIGARCTRPRGHYDPLWETCWFRLARCLAAARGNSAYPSGRRINGVTVHVLPPWPPHRLSPTKRPEPFTTQIRPRNDPEPNDRPMCWPRLTAP